MKCSEVAKCVNIFLYIERGTLNQVHYVLRLHSVPKEPTKWNTRFQISAHAI